MHAAQERAAVVVVLRRMNRLGTSQGDFDDLRGFQSIGFVQYSVRTKKSASSDACT